MSKKLRIAYVHMSFVYSGGGEKLVIKQVEWLRKQGHKVDCYSPLIWPEECFPDLMKEFKAKELLPGFSLIYQRLQMNTMIYFLALLAPIIAWRLRKYDVLIGDHEPGSWFCFVARRLFKVPYVLYLAQPTRLLYQRKIDRDVGLQLNRPMRLSLLLGRILRPVLYLLDKRVMESAAYAVANGKHSQGVIESIYGIETENCPAGAEKARVRVKGKKVKDGNYILLTNRHVPQKKFEYAIEMMRRLKVKFPGLKLMITGGETRYTKQLRELVRKYDLEKKVLFTGYVKERELKSLYGKATIYVYTAPEEDFGMGVIEAMAAGIPVVAWDSGGPAYTVIDGQTGFLIEPYSLKMMRQVIERLLKDKQLRQRMGRAGQERVKQFTWERHGRCLEDYLMRTVKES